MKRTIRIPALLLVFALCLSLAACGKSDAHTAQEYADAIVAARGEEDNTYNEIYARDADGTSFCAHNPAGLSDEEAAASMSLMLEVLGLSEEQFDVCAFSMSLMNVRAYIVGIFHPVEGKGGDVEAALEDYIALQRQSFELYLEDQYEIAKNAKIEQLSDGAYLVVMAEDGEAILSAIKKAL